MTQAEVAGRDLDPELAKPIIRKQIELATASGELGTDEDTAHPHNPQAPTS